MKRKTLLSIIILFFLGFIYIKSYDVSANTVDILTNENRLHKIKSFKTIEIFNRKWIFPKYFNIEPAYFDSTTDDSEIKFRNLISKLINLKYNENANKYLEQGVNCQTVTLYVENWCKINNIDYKIFTEPTHVYISIKIKSDSYVINFNRRLEVYNECTKKSLL